ncbi:MAG: amidohydrolase family protein, partial [Steroidobacteraceae bacterium]|nr:amidohydrolase family protein [Steroidobacteraceae bacterium]
VDVDRAADILQVLKFAERENLRIAIAKGAEAWRVAAELAAAKVPVILDPFANLPASFDEVGATRQNAVRLARAGVEIAFSLTDRGPDRARVLRQAAGNAVAQGLPWETALAAITRVPAALFGALDEVGTIEVGKRADLVLWSGDPLEVSSIAEQVFFDGRPIDMRSRQTELRDRYVERLRPSFR